MIIELKNIADLIHNRDFEKLNRKFKMRLIRLKY